MDSLRHPVGTLPPSVYWRRRVLVLVAVLAVLALLLYACSGSGSPKKNGAKPPVTSTGAATGTASAAVGGASLAGGTAANGGTANGGAAAAGGTTGTPGSATGGAAAVGGATTGEATAGGTTAGGSTGAAATGGTSVGGTTAGGGATGGITAGGATAGGGTTAGGTTGGSSPAGSCDLTLTLTPSAPAYGSGDHPTFAVVVLNKGTADCTVDVSPKALALTIFSGNDRIWSTADCADGKADLRAIAPGSLQQITVNWPRVRSAPGCTGAATPAALGTYFAKAALPNAVDSQPKVFQLKTGS